MSLRSRLIKNKLLRSDISYSDSIIQVNRALKFWSMRKLLETIKTLGETRNLRVKAS